MPYGLEKFRGHTAFLLYSWVLSDMHKGKNYHSRRHTIKTYAQKYKNVERGKRGFAKNLLLKIYKNLSVYMGKWEVIL